MDITPLNRRKAADIVHDRIREMILSGQWKVGERIPAEPALCTMFGVSRVTIREATHRLTGQGLLTVRQGDGTYVGEVTPASILRDMLPLLLADGTSIRQALEFRMLLEVECARLAARGATEEETRLLHDILAEERKSGHTAEENALLDQLFHETIAKAANNPLLETNLALINDILARGIENAFGRMMTEDTLMYHWLILTAIEQHRGQDAANAMKTHIERMIKSVLGE